MGGPSLTSRKAELLGQEPRSTTTGSHSLFLKTLDPKWGGHNFLLAVPTKPQEEKKKKYEELNSFDLASFFSLSDKIMLLSPAARPSLHKHTSAFLLELKQVGI